MPGYQFLHVESYARRPNARGQSVGFVLAEAARRPGACGHVADPRPPVLVFGQSLDALKARHDARAAVATCVTRAGRVRRIRSDQHTLLTVVVSHPSLSGEQPDAVALWQARTVAWLRAEWGERLQTVVRHDDEAYPHLHGYVLPDGPGLRARLLHRGVMAKERARADALAAGHTPRQANKIGDAAYRRALRALQDRYHERVGIACGLARLGPGRRRLTRAAWRTEQAQAEHAARAIAATEAAEARTRQLIERMRTAVAEADVAAARRTVAERLERQSRQRAADEVRRAREQAAMIVAQAEQQADRLRAVGGWMGRLRSGLTGAERRLQAEADERVADVQEAARATVRAATVRAEDAVGAELVGARREVAAARARAEAAESRAAELDAALAAAKRDVRRERSGRERAERERERFRGLWADADNRLQVEHPDPG